MIEKEFSAKSYETALFEAMEAIGASKTSNSFDTTVIGEVIAVYDKRPGTYRVQVENVAFDATTPYDITYKKNDIVYVTILQGDYSKEKHIVGKVTDLSNTLKNFYKTSKLDQMVVKTSVELSETVDNVVVVGQQIPFDKNGLIYHFNTDYSTLDNEVLGMEIALEGPQTNLAIDFSKNPAIKFEFYDKNISDFKQSLVATTAILLMELSGNLGYSIRSFPYKMVKSIGKQFSNGAAKSFNSVKITLPEGWPTKELKAYINRFYFGTEPTNVDKHSLLLRLNVDNGKKFNNSTVQAIVGGAPGEGEDLPEEATLPLLAEFEWEYFDETNNKLVKFNKDTPLNFKDYPDLDGVTITWQKRSEFDPEWTNIQTVEANYSRAYSINDEYNIAIAKPSPSENSKILYYQYNTNVIQPGGFIEYQAILNVFNVVSNTARFENIFNPLTTVYQESVNEIIEKKSKGYTDSEIKKLDDKTTRYLTAGGDTTVTNEYIMTPYIGGGYLNVSNATSRVIIDPGNKTNTNSIFQIWKLDANPSKSRMVVSLDAKGNAIFDGIIYAAEGGKISTWSIDNNSLYNGSWKDTNGVFNGDITFVSTGTTGNGYILGNSPRQNDWVFGCAPNFGVTKKGILYAKDAIISGSITSEKVTLKDNTGVINSNFGRDIPTYILQPTNPDEWKYTYSPNGGYGLSLINPINQTIFTQTLNPSAAQPSTMDDYTIYYSDLFDTYTQALLFNRNNSPNNIMRGRLQYRILVGPTSPAEIGHIPTQGTLPEEYNFAIKVGDVSLTSSEAATQLQLQYQMIGTQHQGWASLRAERINIFSARLNAASNPILILSTDDGAKIVLATQIALTVGEETVNLTESKLKKLNTLLN